MDRLPIRGTPFPFGLTFVPAGALGPVIGATHGPAVDLVEACLELGASFAFVPANAIWAEDAITALAETGVASLAAISGPLWPLIEAKGVAEGLRATLTRPEETAAEIDAQIDSLVAEVARVAGMGARAIVLAEDLAGTQGPLVAPDFAIAELMPLYERIVRAARSLGMPAVFHSDGDLRLLLPAIARAGFVAVHAGGGLGLEAFERLYWAAREEGLAVVGGFVTSELANAARAEALGSHVGVLAKTGGLFVADDGGITTPEEMAALVTALAAARDV
jgi:hypothetical protein